jgi:PEP-CTERM motif
MKTKLFALLALPGLALVGLVSPASADLVEATFTGTVYSSADPDGVFGCTAMCSATDNPFNNYSYTATYLFSTTAEPIYYSPSDNQIVLLGGSNDSPQTDPVLISDSVTISDGSTSHTYHVDTSENGVLQMTTQSGGAFELPYTLVAKVSDDPGDEIYSTVTSSSLPFSITENFGPLAITNGYSELTLGCNGSCPDFIFADITVTLKDISSVPEPSTWILMVIGFAGLGAVGYRNMKSGRSAFSD